MAEQMKAAVFEEFGGAVKSKSIDIPAPLEGEVLIRIKAAGVNPVDNAVKEGYLKDHIPTIFPVIPGWDFAGTITERGFSARRFDVGDEVYGYARRPMVYQGTFAEYIAIPESYIAKKPKNLSWEEAGGVPLVGLTAYQSLFDAGNLQENQTVLILGASGGVGSMAIQLVKERGATAIGVASGRNHDFMKGLGADNTIDYKDNNVGEAVKELVPDGVDLIFDCASGETLEQSLQALKSSGKLVSILHHGEGLAEAIDFSYVFVEPNSRQLDQLCTYADAGKLKVHVSKTYSLDEAAEALEQVQTLHTTGKIIIVP